MFIVRITMIALPEKRKEIMQTLLSMVETAGLEEGCLRYDGFLDLRDDKAFSLIGEWATREDMNRHIRSERFSVLLGTKSLLAQPLDINIHTVSHLEGVQVLQRLRGEGTTKTYL
jgi:quinol monooxygenase YgiN